LGGKPEEVALRQRMIALGLSEFEPDPLTAIESAETEVEADPQPAVQKVREHGVLKPNAYGSPQTKARLG
jgi:hypothetical protein